MVLKALKNRKENIQISFAGAGIDEAYQQVFDNELKSMPKNKAIICLKELPHSEILNLFNHTDVMILPSHGENFGHAIFESLASATPVIISNNTPWKLMQESMAGIEVHADSIEEVSNAIAFFNTMELPTYRLWQEGAFNKALDYIDKNEFEELYKRIFLN